MLVVALAGLALAAAQAPSCDEEIAAIAQCGFANMEELKANMKAEKKEMKNAISACFVDSGCGDPVAAYMAVQDCKKGVFINSVGPALRACVSFDLPDDWLDNLYGKVKRIAKCGSGSSSESEEDEEEEESESSSSSSGSGESWQEKKLAMLEEKLVKYCEGVEEQPVRECVTAIIAAKAAAGGDWKARKAQFKAAKKGVWQTCMEGASKPCVTEIGSRKQQMCQCAEGLQADEALIASVAQEVAACYVSAGASASSSEEGSLIDALAEAVCKGDDSSSSSSSEQQTP